MKFIYTIIFFCLSAFSFAQDVASLVDEGKKLEQKYKEEDAVVKYKQAAQIEPNNIKVLVKLAELHCSIGARQSSLDAKTYNYHEAKKYADAALRSNPADADANYIMAVVFGKLTEVETKKETVVSYVKQTKDYADKALAANPNMGKAWHVLGRWHLEVLTLNPVKKAAVNVLYGGLPAASIDEAITNLEKAKALEPYYCLGYLDLAKAYNFNRQYEKAIATLEQLAKLPSRRQDDLAIKNEGAALLQKLQ